MHIWGKWLSSEIKMARRVTIYVVTFTISLYYFLPESVALPCGFSRYPLPFSCIWCFFDIYKLCCSLMIKLCKASWLIVLFDYSNRRWKPINGYWRRWLLWLWLWFWLCSDGRLNRRNRIFKGAGTVSLYEGIDVTCFCLSIDQWCVTL